VSNLTKRSIYVVTIWQERSDSYEESAIWRVSVEDARTGERRAFAKLEQLQAFLEDRMRCRAQGEISE
jgi:hypothetical protein